MTILVERDGAVLHLVLDRPEKRNALTTEMLSAVRRTFSDAEDNDEVHVVVLRASGPDFCAGFDLSQVRSEEKPEDRFVREERELYNTALSIRNFAKPTIAAIQGGCIAGGLLLSQACDLIVASEEAYFYNPLLRMGGAGLELLMEPWDVGFRQAKRYLFTGERIPADLALRLGMITDLASRDALMSATVELARKVAAMPPMTLRLLKKSILHAQDVMGMRAAFEYHFVLHQFAHTTEESRQLLHSARAGQSLKNYFSKRDEGNLG